MSHGKRVLLVIAGGIAAYKSLDLIRRLRERGVAVRVVMTMAAQHFVTPLAAATLSGEPVSTDLFSLTEESEMGHLRLAQDADLVIVAPATADLLAKMATGLADDLAATALLATAKAWAWLSGRDYVTPDDVKALARPTLRHRVTVRPEAELDGVNADGVLDGVLATVPVPR